MAALLLATTGITLLLWLWHARPQRRRATLTLVAATGLGFQLLHIGEHLIQAAVWAATPHRPPYLTPWATWGADTLAVTGHAPLGQELLHLAGNTIFLLGLLALAARTRPPTRTINLALAWQSAHLLEHLALTLTTATTGRAIGITTLLGTLQPGPPLWSLRVLAHLALNTTASLLTTLALLQIARTRAAPRAEHVAEGTVGAHGRALVARHGSGVSG